MTKATTADKRLERFVLLVGRMRSAQQRYFETRAKADLIRSKELEKETDDALALYLQLPMFDP